jgi:lysyl-tRNA synthetase class 2
MQIRIENDVLERYPEAEIGYLVARVSVKKSDPYVEGLKQGLAKSVQERGINATNFVVHPHLAIWRTIYEEDFQVNPKTFRSSVEALLRRVVTGKEMWSISNVVDLYNCCSILSLMPMGGYDLNKVSRDITIRYAKEGETFQGLGIRLPIETNPEHIVYADDKRLICWLWNHKDAEETCIDENTEYVIFFIDSAKKVGSVQEALDQLVENLLKIEAVPLESGILSRAAPQATINIPKSVTSGPL